MNLKVEYVFAFILNLLIAHSSAARLFGPGCSVSINNDLHKFQPLILLQNKATTDLDAFAFPQNNDTILFNTGETIDLACPGGSIIIDTYNTGKSEALAKCLRGKTFLIENISVPFRTIGCSANPYHIARYTNKKCFGTFNEIEIGFNVSNRFIKHISACFDKKLQHTLYSKSVITSSIKGYQSKYPRPDFIMGKFYDVKPSTISKLYTRNEQRRTINKILRYPANATHIINEKNDFFLARGHYTAKADYVFGAQQRLTFYYINVTPQWQVSNGGNWEVLESHCRKLAGERKIDLIVYTGAFGVTTLPDINGNHQELYLFNEGNKQGVPVPKFMFKVLFEPKSKAGIAFVSVNNPYNEITEKDVICRDICHKINWLNWDRFNVTSGYSYCCDIDDFKRSAPFLPNFTVNKLLV